jgi:hypothetical protein
MRLSAYIAVLLAVSMSFSSGREVFACSPRRIDFSPFDRERIPPFTSADYFFIGEVIGEVEVGERNISGQMSVTALQVRVLISQTSRARPGEILTTYKTTMGGKSCNESWAESLTIKDMPIGSKVRIVAPSLRISSWEVKNRIVRVNENNERLEVGRVIESPEGKIYIDQ